MTAPKLPEGLEPVAWKCGNEFAPYHPQASHTNPDHRDGWNACYRAAQAALQALAAEKDLEIAALKEDADRYRWLRMNRLWLKANLPGIAAPLFDAAIDSALALAAKEAK